LKNNVKNENKKVFLEPIEERNIENINEIIKRYIKKGTTIYTDCWKGYNELNKIGYKHKTVNHKKHFKCYIEYNKDCKNNQTDKTNLFIKALK
jgi:transposase-like protein